MAALDLLGRRWTLRIIWELRHEPVGARALRDRCDGMSSSVLYQRLDELQSAQLVTKNDEGDYTLTTTGRDLLPVMASLSSWSDAWAEGLSNLNRP